MRSHPQSKCLDKSFSYLKTSEVLETSTLNTLTGRPKIHLDKPDKRSYSDKKGDNGGL